MNKESGRYAVGDGKKNEQKSRDHRKANVSFLRQMQCYFGDPAIRIRQQGRLRFCRACASQSRFAPISSISMDRATFRCFIDGGKERSDIRRLRFRLAGAFAQSSNTRENATISE